MIILIIQKDTFENEKMKCMLKVIEGNAENFLSHLQESQAFECQLLAYTNNNAVLFDKLIHFIQNYKTPYGKDWYDFDTLALSKVISLLLESGKTVIDISVISTIFSVNLEIDPIIIKRSQCIENIKNK